MKPRSAEALARRAAKRGRTVEEQKALDRGTKKSKRKELHNKPGEAPAAAAGALKRKAADDMAPVAKVPAVGAPAQLKGAPAPKKRRQDREKKPGSNWKIPVPSEDQIDENRKLREAMRANPEALSEEERARGAMLLARDERKRQKKEARRSEKAEVDARRARARGNRQRKRRQDARPRTAAGTRRRGPRPKGTPTAVVDAEKGS